MPIDQNCPKCHKDTLQNPENSNAGGHEIVCPYCDRKLVAKLVYRLGDWHRWWVWVPKDITKPLRNQNS